MPENQEKLIWSFSREAGRSLTVVFSPYRTLSLEKYTFDGNVLRLADLTQTYYVEVFDELIERIRFFISKTVAERVVLLGTSKGGFGAILAGAALARDEGLTVRCLAFSPQTEVFPENRSLPFPSYKRLIKRISKDSDLRKRMEFQGSLRSIRFHKRFRLKVFYCAGNAIDREEAVALSGKGVTLVEMPFSFHASLLPFVLDRGDPDAARLQLSKLYDRADDDALASLPRDADELYRQLVDIEVPALRDIIASAFQP